MARPTSGKKSGKSLLEKRRLKQEKRNDQATVLRKRDRLQSTS